MIAAKHRQRMIAKLSRFDDMEKTLDEEIDSIDEEFKSIFTGKGA